MRQGFTLPELLSVIAIAGIVLAIATPPLSRALDRAAVTESVDRFAALHATARQLAIARNTLARLEVDPARRAATLSVRRSPTVWDSVGRYDLGSATMACSNPTLIFGPLGLGYGTSNSRVIFARGAAADTVTTSRTGRLRR